MSNAKINVCAEIVVWTENEDVGESTIYHKNVVLELDNDHLHSMVNHRYLTLEGMHFDRLRHDKAKKTLYMTCICPELSAPELKKAGWKRDPKKKR